MDTATPRTDAHEAEHRFVDPLTYEYATIEFARTLERELIASAERVKVLEAALRGLLDALNAEAKAEMTANVASDNFTNDAPELEAHCKALERTCEAIGVARQALGSAK